MSFNKETGMYEGFIYCITNKINGKKYIGQTTRAVRKRWNEHKKEASALRKHSKYLYTAMNSYGVDNFDIQTIQCVQKTNKEELVSLLNVLEEQYINDFQTAWNQNGYNLALGGLNSARKGSEIVQYTIDGLVIGEFDSFSDLARIEQVEPSTIERQCKRHLCVDGKTVLFYKSENFDTSLIIYPNLHIIKQYTTEGHLVNIFHNTLEIRNNTNFNIDAILRCCRGLSKTSGGYVWRYGDDKFGDIDFKRKTNDRKLNAYDLNNVFVRTFDTYKDVMIEYNMKSNPSIYASLNNHNKTSCGFRWYYADDETQPDKTKIIKAS